ncbi:hypothetical protein BJ165DRAFT_1486230 [Panaeolus papilionaceus]|nr:hypothetical protein BJ165DRAFT_1486230 [Panaeolus papilionaceus]
MRDSHRVRLKMVVSSHLCIEHPRREKRLIKRTIPYFFYTAPRKFLCLPLQIFIDLLVSHLTTKPTLSPFFLSSPSMISLILHSFPSVQGIDIPPPVLRGVGAPVAGHISQISIGKVQDTPRGLRTLGDIDSLKSIRENTIRRLGRNMLLSTQFPPA